MIYEDWCNLLYRIKVKDNREREATQIKKIDSARSASIPESNKYVRIQRKKKARLGDGVLCSNKGSHNKAPTHHGNHHHCMLFKKAGIPEQKYMPYIDEDCFGKCSNQKTIKDGLGGNMGSRDETVKQYKKYKSKWNKEVKALKNQKRMLFSISNKSGSCRELNNIKNIRAKYSKKRCNSSSDNSDSDSSLSRNSDCDTYRQSSGREDMNKLDHLVKNNIKTNKDQLNKAI